MDLGRERRRPMSSKHPEALEQNELRAGLTRLADEVKSGTSPLYYWVGGAIVVVALFWAWSYWSASSQTKVSASWLEFDKLTNPGQLEAFAEKHRGTPAARAAQFQQARIWLKPEGLDLIGAGNPDARDTAVTNLEKARTLYAKLAGEVAAIPVLAAEALLAQAQIEEAFIGVPLKDKPGEWRGSLDKAKTLYGELAAKYKDFPQGKLAEKRLDDIEKHRDEIVKFYTELNKTFTPPPAVPSVTLPPITPPPAPTPTPEPKKDEPKKDDAKKADPPKTEPKKDEPKSEKK